MVALRRARLLFPPAKYSKTAPPAAQKNERGVDPRVASARIVVIAVLSDARVNWREKIERRLT